MALLAACHANPAIHEGRTYPASTARAATLDIQVYRRGICIELTNTTARSFGPSTLWLNGRFSKTIPGLAVGEHVEYQLKEFTDQFGEPFRAGGFFATEVPDALVLAEIETPTLESAGDSKPQMLGLVVVGGQEP